MVGYCQKTDVASLEGYANLGNESYQDRATKYLSDYKLNDNGELEITDFLQVGAKKNEMYDNIINWIVASCTDAATAIIYENEEEGRITARCHFGKIANDGKKKPKEWVDIRPTLSVSIQDNEAIMKFYLPGFEVMQKSEEGDNFGFMGNSLISGIYGSEMLFRYLIFTIPTLMMIWPLIDCFPYNKDCKYNKATCYMAYVHAIECYKILKQQVLNAGYKSMRKKKK